RGRRLRGPGARPPPGRGARPPPRAASPPYGGGAPPYGRGSGIAAGAVQRWAPRPAGGPSSPERAARHSPFGGPGGTPARFRGPAPSSGAPKPPPPAPREGPKGCN